MQCVQDKGGTLETKAKTPVQLGQKVWKVALFPPKYKLGEKVAFINSMGTLEEGMIVCVVEEKRNSPSYFGEHCVTYTILNEKSHSVDESCIVSKK